ncbi:hypothetical protein [Streptomyces sp. NPDC052127]|uniref:hypothetical protein n=1 Tax=Streptomyces sp. NPDC052127 TaxID=3155679 RepID=UPI0034325637
MGRRHASGGDPPPHHDIYSIEDPETAVHDLKNARRPNRGMGPFRTISRLRCPRSIWRAVRPNRLRGCVHPRTWEIGYSGGDPHALATYLTQVATTDGHHTTVGAPYEDAHPAILAWTQSKTADRGTNELSLSDLQAMMAS